MGNDGRHGGTETRVEIAGKRVPNAVEIHIADDGPGISDQEQAVFSTGVETPLIHGSGLGLWVVYWIVSSHGGRTEVTASVDGTTMMISVPHETEGGLSETVVELQRARDLYEAAFEDAIDAMVIIDDDAKILDANPQVKEIFGIDRQELLGRSILEFLPDDFDFEVAWDEFKDGGAVGTAEFIGADGVSRMVEYTGKPDVIPGHHFVIYRDISERLGIEQQLVGERQFADAILNAIPNMLYVFDPNGYPIWWNAPVEDATGYSAEEISEMHVTEFIPDDEVKKISAAVQAVLEEGERVTVTSAFETKDGKRISHEFTGAPVRDTDGTILGLAGIGRRLTSPASPVPHLSEILVDK
jgi:PAS domain S-box-containing protein